MHAVFRALQSMESRSAPDLINCRAQVSKTSSWGEDNEHWRLFVTRFFNCDFCHREEHLELPTQSLQAACLRAFPGALRVLLLQVSQVPTS